MYAFAIQIMAIAPHTDEIMRRPLPYHSPGITLQIEGHIVCTQWRVGPAADRFSLSITRPYSHITVMDNRSVPCVGPIKDLCVYLNQYLTKCVVVVVVVDIPASFATLPSRQFMGSSIRRISSIGSVICLGTKESDSWRNREWTMART